MEFFDAGAAQQAFLAALHDGLQDALDAFDVEFAAARNIQRIFRGFRVRLVLHELMYYATELQRVYRGHLGRRRARAAVELRAVARATAAAAHLALQMQRLYRGFRSRKYVHNYYARKRFIAALTRKHEELRSQLEEQAARQEQALAAAHEKAARAEFERVAARLHHLVSTRAIPGVYNPPWAQDYQLPSTPLGTLASKQREAARRAAHRAKTGKPDPAAVTVAARTSRGGVGGVGAGGTGRSFSGGTLPRDAGAEVTAIVAGDVAEAISGSGPATKAFLRRLADETARTVGRLHATGGLGATGGGGSGEEAEGEGGGGDGSSLPPFSPLHATAAATAAAGGFGVAGAGPGSVSLAYPHRGSGPPTAFGLPLETHLRAATIKHLRTHGYHTASTAHMTGTNSLAQVGGTSASAGAAGGGDALGGTGMSTGDYDEDKAAGRGTRVALGLPPMPGSVPVTPAVPVTLGAASGRLVASYVQPSRASMQASTPYDAPVVAERQRARISALARIGGPSARFTAGGTHPHALVPALGEAASLNASHAYIDTWRLAQNDRDTEHSAEQKAKRVADVPWISRDRAPGGGRPFEDTERQRVHATQVQVMQLTGGAGLTVGAAALASGSGGGGGGGVDDSENVGHPIGGGGLRGPAAALSATGGIRTGGTSRGPLLVRTGGFKPGATALASYAPSAAAGATATSAGGVVGSTSGGQLPLSISRSNAAAPLAPGEAAAAAPVAASSRSLNSDLHHDHHHHHHHHHDAGDMRGRQQRLSTHRDAAAAGTAPAASGDHHAAMYEHHHHQYQYQHQYHHHHADGADGGMASLESPQPSPPATAAGVAPALPAAAAGRRSGGVAASSTRPSRGASLSTGMTTGNDPFLEGDYGGGAGASASAGRASSASPLPYELPAASPPALAAPVSFPTGTVGGGVAARPTAASVASTGVASSTGIRSRSESQLRAASPVPPAAAAGPALVADTAAVAGRRPSARRVGGGTGAALAGGLGSAGSGDALEAFVSAPGASPPLGGAADGYTVALVPATSSAVGGVVAGGVGGGGLRSGGATSGLQRATSAGSQSSFTSYSKAGALAGTGVVAPRPASSGQAAAGSLAAGSAAVSAGGQPRRSTMADAGRRLVN